MAHANRILAIAAIAALALTAAPVAADPFNEATQYCLNGQNGERADCVTLSKQLTIETVARSLNEAFGHELTAEDIISFNSGWQEAGFTAETVVPAGTQLKVMSDNI